MSRPRLVWPLIFLLLLLALGGFSGAVPMLLDPSGEMLGAAAALPLLPVPNFILPGLFLLVVMGLLPLILALSLAARPNWPGFERLFQWSGHYWAWTATLLLVLVLALWLVYEIVLIGWFPMTYVTAVLGLLIFLLAVPPSVRDYYAV